MRITVADVMTTDIIAVRKDASFRTVATLLIDKNISGLPVLDERSHVLGVVSEADLLCKEEFKRLYYTDTYWPTLRARLCHRVGSEGAIARKARAQTAEGLMTSPAIVTTDDSPVVLAARMMDRHGVKRLPVVDADGAIVGIVTRHDLIKVFARPDPEIEKEIAEYADPAAVEVKQGVVTLTGEVHRRSQVLNMVRLTESLDGVVAVENRLTWRSDDIPPGGVWGGA